MGILTIKNGDFRGDFTMKDGGWWFPLGFLAGCPFIIHSKHGFFLLVLVLTALQWLQVGKMMSSKFWGPHFF